MVSGSASCVDGDAIHCEGIGWGSLKKPECISCGRQDWNEGLRAVRICPGRAWVGPGLQKERERACVTRPGNGGPGRGRVQCDGLAKQAYFIP